MEGISIHTSNIGSEQIYITGSVDQPGVDPVYACQALYRKIYALLEKQNLRIFHERVFGNLQFYDTLLNIRQEFPTFKDEPLTYIEGDTYWGGGLAGLQIHAIKQPSRKEDLVTIQFEDSVCGRLWRNHDTTYVSLQTIAEKHIDNSQRSRQTAAVFDRINAILKQYRFSFANVVRTWIYLSDILEWYDEFNQVRTEKFKKFNIFSGIPSNNNIDTLYLPASTGISGRNPVGSWSAVDVLAVGKEDKSELTVYPLTRGEQRSAFRYGSAFSRGMCLQNSAYRQLLVSGTAAINAQGKSLYINDSEAQIYKTFEIVESLLKKEGGQLKHICSATIFLKKREDIHIYREVVKKLNLQKMPAIIVIADVCREELLFELDAIAVVQTN
jgi:enamine deaminase RidA (YjgF/YER057c/UK114 family)